LETGRVILDGDREALGNDDRIRQAYLGMQDPGAPGHRVGRTRLTDALTTTTYIGILRDCGKRLAADTPAHAPTNERRRPSRLCRAGIRQQDKLHYRQFHRRKLKHE
jgi:hypothetical protein